MPSVIVPIDLGGNKKGAVSVDSKTADYFNITAPTTATAAMIEKPRTSFQRKVYSGPADITGRTITVNPGARSVRPPKAASASGGKSMRVPTEVIITRTVAQAGVNRTIKYVKHVSIRFPSGASMAAISKWLFENIKAHKPNYFLTPTGSRYLVVDDTGVTDINPVAPASAPS